MVGPGTLAAVTEPAAAATAFGGTPLPFAFPFTGNGEPLPWFGGDTAFEPGLGAAFATLVALVGAGASASAGLWLAGSATVTTLAALARTIAAMERGPEGVAEAEAEGGAAGTSAAGAGALGEGCGLFVLGAAVVVLAVVEPALAGKGMAGVDFGAALEVTDRAITSPLLVVLPFAEAAFTARTPALIEPEAGKVTVSTFRVGSLPSEGDVVDVEELVV